MPVMIKFIADGGAWLAPVDEVLGVRLIDDVRALPDPGPEVLGVLDLDGASFPVLRTLSDHGRHVLVISQDGEVVGVVVDEVCGVADIDLRSIRRRPAGQSRPFVGAVHDDVDDPAYVLDGAEIVRSVTASTGGGS